MINFKSIKPVYTGLAISSSLLFLSACGGGNLEAPEFETEPTPVISPGPEPTPTPIPQLDVTLGDGYEELDLLNANLDNRADDAANPYDPWTVQGSTVLTVVSSDSRDLIYSVSATGRTDTWNGPRYDLVDSEGASMLESNTVYKVFFSAKMIAIEGGAATENVEITLSYQVTGAASPEYIGLASASVGTDEWVDIEGEFTTADLSDLESGPFVYIQSGSATSSYLVDTLIIGKKLPPELSVLNGGFENNEVTPWITQGGLAATGLTINTNNVREGSYSLEVKGRQNSYEGPAYSLLPGDNGVVLEANTDYIGSVWVKMISIDSDLLETRAQATETDPDAPSDPYDKVQMTIKTSPPTAADSEYNGFASDDYVTTTGWTLIRGTFNSGDLPNATEKFVYIEAGGATSSYLVDGLKFRKADAPVEEEASD